MAKIFTKLNIGDIVATSGARVFRKLTTEDPSLPMPTEAGLYDTRNKLLADWDTLVNDYGLNIGIDYVTNSERINYYQTTTSSPYYILNNYPEFAKATRLVMPTRAISVVTELPTTNIDTDKFYNLNGVLYRYEETGSDDSLLGTWKFKGGSTYGYGETMGKNYFTFYYKATGITYYGFYKSTSSAVIDHWEFYASEDYSKVTSLLGVSYSTSEGIHIRYNHLTDNGSKVVVTNVESMTANGLAWWKAQATKIANEYSWVAYDAAQTIPDSVTHIGDCAFYGCDRLTSIVLPESLTSIGDSAFGNNYSLIEVCNKSSLNITAGGTDYGGIGRYAKYITTDDTQSIIKYVRDYVFVDDSTYIFLLKYLGNETELTLPDYKGGFYIYDNAFRANSGLISVTIPNSVTAIANNAFYYCVNLATVTIGNSITTIEEGAFSGSGDPITFFINSNKLADIKLKPGNIYFNAYSEDTEILFDVTNFLTAGSSKGTYTYNIYTDNSTIKAASIAYASDYTIVNVYHLDGGDWGE